MNLKRKIVRWVGTINYLSMAGIDIAMCPACDPAICLKLSAKAGSRD